jgi:hypothetical protein
MINRKNYLWFYEKRVKVKAKKTDPLFDGHPEKSIKDMTPSERLDYLCAIVEFRLINTNKLNPEPPINKNNG